MSFLAGGGALALVAVYLAKAVYAFASSKKGVPSARADMISRADHEQLMAIYGEIEHSREDREEMLRILRASHGLIKDLHKWHNQTDEDGVLKWLNKPSVEREIKRIGRMLDSAIKRSSGTGRSGNYSLDLRDKKK